MVLIFAGASAVAGDWPTGRGNPQRTGNLDDKPGPNVPHVLWAYKAPENFIASPVPGPKDVFASALGAFNASAFHALAKDEAAKDRESWSKAAPWLKMAVVCAPSYADGLLVLGDGMHQTDGATLYGLSANTGRPYWQYAFPGRLIHLEGSPTLEAGRVYSGGGNAGVFCIDSKRITIDGQEKDLAAVIPVIEQKWKELDAKYEADKKKDPALAIPPSDDALPKASPKLVWQQGKDKWHVDSPVLVTHDRVFAASAFLDDEKIGDRSLLCLNAADGNVVWRAELKLNPWGGPTLAGDIILLGCTSIRFDKKLVPGAKGEVVAVDANSGQVKWRKDVPGGVLSAIAVKNDLAVFTATDGKVRGWGVADGTERWVYDAKTPFFAGAAVAGGIAYAADLKGVLHAITIADGKVQWTFDVSTDPAVQSPGEAYGSPVVQDGQIYLTTCNIDFEGGDQPASAVICISDHAGTSAAVFEPIVVDKQKRTISVPAKIAPRKLPSLKDIYPLEVIASYPTPRGQKSHETVVTYNCRPSDVHKALEELGLKPGKPARGDGEGEGPLVDIYLVLPGTSSSPRMVPIEKTMTEPRTGRPLPHFRWHFTGSVLRQPDPDKDYKVYGADVTGTLISILPVTDETVFQANLTMKEEPYLKMETNKALLPDEGTPVQLLIKVP